MPLFVASAPIPVKMPVPLTVMFAALLARPVTPRFSVAPLATSQAPPVSVAVAVGPVRCASVR